MSRFLLKDAEFANGWRSLSRTKRLLSVLVLLLLPVATLFALAVMGPRLVREGNLLWFGSTANGTLRAIDLVEVGRFKDGAPKHRLTLAYAFATPDGRSHTGITVRTDIRYVPTLKVGDPISVYYEPAHPDNAVADYNLRTDVYALLLFLPFLSLIGLGLPGLYGAMFLRSLRERRRRASASSRHWVRKPR